MILFWGLYLTELKKKKRLHSWVGKKTEFVSICMKSSKILTRVTNDEQLEEMMVVFSRHSSVQKCVLMKQQLSTPLSRFLCLKVPGCLVRRVLGEILRASCDRLSSYPQNSSDASVDSNAWISDFALSVTRLSSQCNIFISAKNPLSISSHISIASAHIKEPRFKSTWNVLFAASPSSANTLPHCCG